jgi:hypothetical protein
LLKVSEIIKESAEKPGTGAGMYQTITFSRILEKAIRGRS